MSEASPEEAESLRAAARTMNAQKIPRGLKVLHRGPITKADVAHAVVAVQEAWTGERAMERRQRGQYVNPARQNRNATARALGLSKKAARKALKRWRREAAQIARSPAVLATISSAEEARDRGLL